MAGQRRPMLLELVAVGGNDVRRELGVHDDHLR
jgi:hypothetical protein